MLRSSLPSISRGLVYINTLGRTCLHELFIQYERVIAWEARFLFQQSGGKLSYIINRRLHWMAQWISAQVAGTTVWLTSNSHLEGTIGRVADTAHTGSFINPPQSPQPSVDSHRAINTNDINLLLWSNMENLKPTPRVVLRLGGYNDMTRQISRFQ